MAKGLKEKLLNRKMMMAVETGNIPLMQALYEQGVPLNLPMESQAYQNQTKRNVKKKLRDLNEAVRKENYFEINRIYSQQMDTDTRSNLFVARAFEKGQRSSVRFLIENGAPVYLEDIKILIRKGDIETLKILQQRQPDLFKKTEVVSMVMQEGSKPVIEKMMSENLIEKDEKTLFVSLQESRDDVARPLMDEPTVNPVFLNPMTQHAFLTPYLLNPISLDHLLDLNSENLFGDLNECVSIALRYQDYHMLNSLLEHRENSEIWVQILQKSLEVKDEKAFDLALSHKREDEIVPENIVRDALNSDMSDEIRKELLKITDFADFDQMSFADLEKALDEDDLSLAEKILDSHIVLSSADADKLLQNYPDKISFLRENLAGNPSYETFSSALAEKTLQYLSTKEINQLLKSDQSFDENIPPFMNTDLLKFMKEHQHISLNEEALTDKIMKNASSETIKMLLDENILDVTQPLLVSALQDGRDDVALALLRKGANPIIYDNVSQKRKIDLYARNARSLKYLLDHQESVIREDIPLLLTSIINENETLSLDFLLLHYQDEKLWQTALAQAIEKNSPDMIKAVLVRQEENYHIPKDMMKQALEQNTDRSVLLYMTDVFQKQEKDFDFVKFACDKKDLILLKQMLDNGVKITTDNMNEIRWEKTDTDVVRFIVEYKEKHHEPDTEEFKRQLMDISVQKNHPNVIQYLCDHGMRLPDSAIADAETYDVLLVLCKNGANPYGTDKDGLTAFEKFVDRSRPFQEYLMNYVPIYNNRNSLHQSVMDHRWKDVMSLVKQGAPLTEPVVNLLSANWGDVSCQGSGDLDKLMQSCQQAKEKLQMRKVIQISQNKGLSLAPAMEMAVENGNRSLVKEFQRAGVRSPETAMLALQNNQLQIFTDMPAAEINWTHRNQQGEPLLHQAVQSGMQGLNAVLKKAESGQNVDFNMYDEKGDTPLTLLARPQLPLPKSEKQMILQKLLETPADVNRPNCQTGNTLLTSLMENGEEGKMAVSLLESPKAKVSVKNKEGESAYTIALKRKNEGKATNVDLKVLEKYQQETQAIALTAMAEKSH